MAQGQRTVRLTSRKALVALAVLVVVASAILGLAWRRSGSAARVPAWAAPATASSVHSSATTPPSQSPAAASPGRSASARPGASTTARAPAVPPGSRAFTILNATQQTIWAAATQNKDHPLTATGWVLTPGQSVTVAVPGQWGGRFWGRTGCTFDTSGHGHCQTGDCGGRFQCTGSGATPATLAEYSLAAWGGMDFYDVSMVDGSNLPMYINISGGTTKDPLTPVGCSSGGCTHPVDCPSAMQVTSGGQVVACKTACSAFGTDDYCCRGAWSGRANCVPARWPVNFTEVFKEAEPYAYSYAYDDSATMSCKGGCNYRITFGVTP
jgi:hypothetical protein